MEESLYKFTTVGSRIHLVFLNKAVKEIQKAHNLTDYQADKLGRAAALAECLVANRKEDNAAIAVTVKYPKEKMQFTAIAEKDGRVRGNCEEYDVVSSITDGVVLEITQKLTVRGDYSSIVSGKNEEDAIGEYYRVSQQTEARCAVTEYGDTYSCLLVEQFPITCAEEEKYRGSCEAVWEYLKPFREGESVDLTLFEKYRKVAHTPLKFGCTCTRRSVRAALESVDKDELLKAADEDGFVEVNCKYCGKKYRIPVEG